MGINIWIIELLWSCWAGPGGLDDRQSFMGTVGGKVEVDGGLVVASDSGRKARESNQGRREGS